MAQPQQYASFATEDLRQSSGLWDDVDITITSFEFTTEPPDGYTAEGGIFAHPIFVLDGDGPEEERTQAGEKYSLGKKSAEEFTISDDKQALIPIDSTVRVRDNSKWVNFTKALETAGVPKTTLAKGHFGFLVGLRGHVKRIEDKKMEFADSQRRSKFPPSTLVITKLLEPAKASAAGKAGGNAAAKSGSAPAASAPVAATGDLDTDTMSYLQQALEAAKDRTIQRGQIVMAVAKMAMKSPKRAEYAKRASDEGFLTSMAELGLITYAAAERGQPVSLVG